jgi:hypothetical protein
MLTSRRDYLLRIIDEVGRILGQIVFKRRTGSDQEALETVVVGFQRLFQLDGDQVFQLTPNQHYEMLTRDAESPELARDQVLLYAALSTEAGRLYAKLNNRERARVCFLNALQFALRARIAFPREGLPPYAPDIGELRSLAGEPLDADTQQLLLKAAVDGTPHADPE